jgi:hypothetical protein
MTLVDLVKKLKAIQEAHPMIRTFGEGDIYDYVDNGGEIQYPVLWTVVKPSVYSGTTMRYDLVLLFADLLTEDKSNRLQIQSDQMLVALDFLAKLKLDNDYTFNTAPNAALEFFQERFDDFTAGVSIAVQVIAPMPLNLCAIPTEPAS